VAARRAPGTLSTSLPASVRDVCLIVNPSAGGGRAARELPAVEAALRARGAAFRVERTESLEHARDLARSTLAPGELTAAMGGDGLVGAVAGALRGTSGVLGLLPGGRGNDFARKLGIGPDPVAACDVLAEGRELAVDVADVDGRTFVGIASAGLDSDVQVVANATRLPLGTLVYLYGTLHALARWRPARWTVTLDGRTCEFEGYSVAVANSGVYGGGMRLAPDASLTDGELDVVLTEDTSRLRFLRNLTRVFTGSHVGEPTLHIERARVVTFEADRPFAAYADGDPIAELPATVRVVPGALRVMVPA
jgi:YegS/Rv2252/BmrU family lipid kinase